MLVMGSIASVSVDNRYLFSSVSLVMISSVISMNLSANCSFCIFRDPFTFCKVVTSSVLSHPSISPLSLYYPCCVYCSILIVFASVCSCSSMQARVCSLLILSRSLIIGVISIISGQTIWIFSDFSLLL